MRDPHSFFEDYRAYMAKVREAKAEGRCVQCGEPALEKCYSAAGRREYEISGLCEVCFDTLTRED